LSKFTLQIKGAFMSIKMFTVLATATCFVATASIADARGGVASKICKRKDNSNRCIEWAVENAATQGVIAGGRKAKEKVVEAVKREKNCTNTQGGNNANSTAAVRTC
jgi:hypothetical protein